MCECFTGAQSRKLVKSEYGGCGCLGMRRFMTSEEEAEILESYKKQLQKELTGVEEKLKQIKGQT
ncbi:MAG: hypothetical protein WED07_14630 [Candidatus Freyarchaeum deiterrae]